MLGACRKIPFLAGCAIILCSTIASAQSADISSASAPLEPPYAASVTPPVNIGEHICSTQKSYPAEAAAVHAEGSTVLSFVVTTDGTVSDPKVLESSGNAALDDASVSCVLPWKFQPAMQDGKPIAVVKKVRQMWQLHP